MRPRKVVLIADGNEVRGDILAFALDTRGYRVVQAGDYPAAQQVMAQNDGDGLVLAARLPFPSVGELMQQCRARHGWNRTCCWTWTTWTMCRRRPSVA